jgi:hypothetical protein
MNVRVFFVLVLFLVHLFVGNISCSMLHKSYDEKQIQKLANYAKSIDGMRSTLYLEHKDYNDLLETINIAHEQFKGSVFTLPEVTAIIVKESRFNQYATNKADGGRGYGQISHIGKYYVKELSYMTDPYDKRQNIKAIRIILEDKYKTYKTKNMAIKRYNGAGIRAEKYLVSVLKIKHEIERF